MQHEVAMNHAEQCEGTIHGSHVEENPLNLGHVAKDMEKATEDLIRHSPEQSYQMFTRHISRQFRQFSTKAPKTGTTTQDFIV
jgi:hypothetical protein